MFYVKSGLIFLWLILSCGVCLVKRFFSSHAFDINYELAQIFGKVALRISGIKIKIDGREYLDSPKPCIYVCNHQSAFDIVSFANVFPKKTVVIGKKEVRWIPLFGRLFKGGGNILIDRKNKTDALSGMSLAGLAIRSQGVSVMIFPEGTRNRLGVGLLPFKKGAFYMAVQAQVPLVPILCSPLGPLVSWKKKKIKKGVLEIKVLAPLYLTQGEYKNTNLILERTRSVMLQNLETLKTVVL